MDQDQGWLDAYKSATSTLWNENPIPVLDHAIPLIQGRGKRSVVDVGCGDGRNLIALAKAGLQCAGVDISLTALSNASQKLLSQNLNAFLLAGRCNDLPFADHTVDVLTCFDLFGQLESPEAFLNEAQRALSPGGIIFINAFTINDSEYGKGEKVGHHSFKYKNTLFRFFEEEEFRGLLRDWEVIHFEVRSWNDPPHGHFRPYPHRHENYYTAATPAA